MRYLYLFIFSIFILTGCTQKSIEVQVKKEQTVSTKKQVITKPLEVKDDPLKDDTIIEESQAVDFEIVDDGKNKIAVIYPSKIVGKYAKLSLSTISAYMIYNNQNFELETFDTYNEEALSIQDQINLLYEKGFTKVIALFTIDGFEVINNISQANHMYVYFPLINKEEVIEPKPNLIFGGISYQDQIELLKTVSSDKSAMFYVKSYVGNRLRDIFINTFEPNSIIKEIKRKNNNYKALVNDKRLNSRMIMLNTPVVKSAIVMSQLTAFEIEPSIILSTQLNYKPSLMTLTQYRDRKNFFVANSIPKVESFLQDYISLLGADVKYNWVDYSTLIGVDYLVNQNAFNLIRTEIVDNQAQYIPELYRSTSYGFEKALQE